VASSKEVVEKSGLRDDLLLWCARSRHKVTMALREKDKKVLMLGAGYVSAPVVDYLTRDEHISVTVGRCGLQLRSEGRAVCVCVCVCGPSGRGTHGPPKERANTWLYFAAQCQAVGTLKRISSVSADS